MVDDFTATVIGAGIATGIEVERLDPPRLLQIRPFEPKRFRSVPDGSNPAESNLN